MRKNIINKKSSAINGYMTIENYIEGIPPELEIDAVGLHQIIPTLKEVFDLTDEENLYYIRMALNELYDYGARPVIGAGSLKDSPYDWILQPQYGSTKEQIADNVIKEWQESGKNPDHGGLWFYIPDEYCCNPD